MLLRGNEVVIKDLNSTNGTFINDEKITESVLKPGQTLRLGQIELQLENGAPAAPAAAGATSSAAPAPAPARKPESITRTATRGVSLSELESGGRPVGFDTAGLYQKAQQSRHLFLDWRRASSVSSLSFCSFTRSRWPIRTIIDRRSYQ